MDIDALARDHAALTRLLFVDFEARPTADRWVQVPVEVGLAELTGRAASAFVVPEPSWPALVGERPAAEAWSVTKLAALLTERAKGRTVVSDATFVDQPLLDLLLGGRRIELVSFFQLLDAIKAAHPSLTNEAVNAWIVEIDEARGEAHRAGEDARVRALLMKRVLERIGARTVREASPAG